MFRFLPLLVVGVVAWHRYGSQDNVPHKHPITAMGRQRICADLCRSGLGGESCGDVCFDLMPSGLPVQSPSNNNTREVQVEQARNKVCPVLCENRLGFPLCQCTPPAGQHDSKSFRINFRKICEHYCQHENWVLRGCPVCPGASIRQEPLEALYTIKPNTIMLSKMVNIPGTSFKSVSSNQRVDWGKWCHIQCENSNGGSACNCDILPFSF